MKKAGVMIKGPKTVRTMRKVERAASAAEWRKK